ncbi:FecCD family ABC transporter permease [Aeromicrobium sp. P5_D10]
MSTPVPVLPSPEAPTVSDRRRSGSWRGLAILTIVVVVCVIASIAIGSKSFSPLTVMRALLTDEQSEVADIVHGLRVPRTILALMVGISLGVAGALMQGHTRNPLADPGLLGVSAGASFAVVIAIYWFNITQPTGYVWFAFIGAGLAASAVFAIGSTRGGPSPVTLVLAGAAVSALLGSLTAAVVLSDSFTLNAYRFWVVGSTSGRDSDVVRQVIPFIVLGLFLAAISTRGLNLLQLGDDLAKALGANPLRHKIIGLAAVMLLTGAATAACGPIGFLGLVVPHLARPFSGVDYRWVVPYSGLFGAILLLVADIAGRLVIWPSELSVGIVMALIGGPALIWIVRRTQAVGL